MITDRIATVDQAVTSPAERQKLAQKAGARAVDMETQAVIESGTRAGVPIRALRVVGDTYEDDLTPLFGNDKTFSWWRIALRLLRPQAWPVASRQRRQTRQALENLVQALKTYLGNKP